MEEPGDQPAHVWLPSQGEDQGLGLHQDRAEKSVEATGAKAGDLPVPEFFHTNNLYCKGIFR